MAENVPVVDAEVADVEVRIWGEVEVLRGGVEEVVEVAEVYDRFLRGMRL